MDIEPFVRIETTAFKERQSMIDKINEIITECNDFDDDISGKADKSDTYTKTEINNRLSLKADKSDTYTKSQIDNELLLKADKSDTYTKTDVYTKSETNTILHTDYYTKYQVDEIIENLDIDLTDYYDKTETDNLLEYKCDKTDYYDKSDIDYMLSHISTDGLKDVTDLVNYSFIDKRITADIKAGDIIFINAVANVRFGTTTYADVNINYCAVLDSTGKKIRMFDLVDVGEPSEIKTVFKDVTDSIATITPTETRYIDMDVFLIDMSTMNPTGNRTQSITLNTFKVFRGE